MRLSLGQKGSTSISIIQTDHKPLVAIKKKNLHAAPAWLQRVILQLQKFDIYLESPFPWLMSFLENFLKILTQKKEKGLDAHVFSVVENLPVKGKKLEAI